MVKELRNCLSFLVLISKV